MSDTRGIVLESNNGWSTILMEGGHYKKVRRTLEVGNIYHENIRRPYSKYAAAAVFLFMLVGTIDFFNVVAYASVSTGVEMGINRWDRVITVKQTDPAEKSIPLKDLSLRGQKVEDAVAILVQNALTQTKNSQDIEIQINSQENRNEKLEEKLLGKIETSVTDEEKYNQAKDTTLVRNGKNIQIKTKENQAAKNNAPGQLKKENNQSNASGGNGSLHTGEAIIPSPDSRSAEQPGVVPWLEQEQLEKENKLNNAGDGSQLGQDGNDYPMDNNNSVKGKN